MSRKNTLEGLKKKMALDEVESKIAKELVPSDNDYTNENYLSHYDASLINKGIVQTPKEQFDEDE